MENRNSLTPFAVTTSVLLLVAIATLFGCSGALQSTGSAGRMPYDALLKYHENGEQRALRVKADTARNRLWVLGLQNVFIYDINGQQLIRRVALPAWSVAGINCPPDLILDRSGSALVSSNAEPRLWKIDTADFSIKEHAITLLGREGWETGFSALAFSADGTLFGLSAFAGSLWRIELATSSAEEVRRSERVLNTCELTLPR
jgi:hypothetical protein